MSFLKSIKKTANLPPRMFIYGGEKLGKSTFVSQCPGVVFIPTESGLNNILAETPPKLTSYEEVKSAINELITQEHDYKAVALDTTTTLERLIHQAIMEKDRVTSIVKAAGGYGNGYVIAAEMMRHILDGLDILWERKNMAIFLIGHAVSKNFANPEGPSYDRWQPRGHENFNSLIIEWADIVGFVGYRERVGAMEADKGRRTIATGIEGDQGNVQRVLRLDGGPTCRAGSRLKMPKEMPLDWTRFTEELAKAKNTGV
jgi:hypothetical protein